MLLVSIISVKRLDLIIDASTLILMKWIYIGEGNQKEAIEEYANRLKDKTFQFLGQIDNLNTETYLNMMWIFN